MTQTLKPCPFCGGEAGIGSDDAYDDVTWQAFCKQCHATIERDLKDHAVELWNTRAALPDPAAEDALREAVRRYQNAVKAVFAIDPKTKKCFAEGSPTKDQEVYERFVELNNSGQALDKALATRPVEHGSDLRTYRDFPDDLVEHGEEG